jgi:hypothetical protein
MTEFQAVNENTRSQTYHTIDLRTLTLTITQLVNPAIGRYSMHAYKLIMCRFTTILLYTVQYT